MVKNGQLNASRLCKAALFKIFKRALDKRRLGTEATEITYKNSILIGIIQAIAILPGISRSGSTISSAVLMGTKRVKAAEFSFLMVLPLIFGSMLKSLFEIESYTSNINIIPRPIFSC